jgi:hypothetical protein
VDEKDRTKKWRVNDSGYLIHDGDCHAWGTFGLCTCGLIHHLMPMENATDLVPDYYDQRAKHEDRLHQLLMIDVYGEWPVSQEAVDGRERNQPQ